MSWIRVEAIKGGHMVACNLCGKRTCREFFMASDTNYAEAFRLATAFAWQHEHGDVHKAALGAFYAEEVPSASKEQELMSRVFGGPLPDERQLRREAAKRAAGLAARALRDSP